MGLVGSWEDSINLKVRSLKAGVGQILSFESLFAEVLLQSTARFSGMVPLDLQGARQGDYLIYYGVEDVCFGSVKSFSNLVRFLPEMSRHSLCAPFVVPREHMARVILNQNGFFQGKLRN